MPAATASSPSSRMARSGLGRLVGRQGHCRAQPAAPARTCRRSSRLPDAVVDPEGQARPRRRLAPGRRCWTTSRSRRATNKATQIVTLARRLRAERPVPELETKGGGSSFLALTRAGRQGRRPRSEGSAQLGTLVSQQVSTQDLQQTLTRQTNGIGTLRRAIAVYEQALQSGSLSASQRIDVQIKLAERPALGSSCCAKARTRTIAVRRNGRHPLHADDEQELDRRRRNPVRAAASAGCSEERAGFLALEGIIVLYALVVLSPLLVLGGLAWGSCASAAGATRGGYSPPPDLRRIRACCSAESSRSATRSASSWSRRSSSPSRSSRRSSCRATSRTSRGRTG